MLRTYQHPLVFTQRIAIYSKSNREHINMQCRQSARTSALLLILHNAWTHGLKLVRSKVHYATMCFVFIQVTSFLWTVSSRTLRSAEHLTQKGCKIQNSGAETCHKVTNWNFRMGNTNTKPLENGQSEETSATISFTHNCYEWISILQPNPVWLCCKLNITLPPIQ